MKFNQIAQTITELEVMSRMLKRDKVEYQNGYEIQGNLLVRHNFSAQQVGLNEAYDRNIVDVLDHFRVPWRQTTFNWSWTRQTLLYNRGASKIVDYLKAQRTAGLISAAEHMEDQFWSKPDDSTNDLDVFGVPYWVVKNPTTGHTGGDPAGFSSGAGNLATATYPHWKNFSGQYLTVAQEDLIDLMIQAKRKTAFRSPIDIDDYKKGNGQRFRIYMNEATIRAYEKLARTQNSNLGRDLAEYMDETAFKKSAVKYCPKLDADSTNPVYMLDYGYFCPVCLKGDTFYEHDARNLEDQPNSWFVDVDCSWNVLCTDRRRQTVLYV